MSVGMILSHMGYVNVGKTLVPTWYKGCNMCLPSWLIINQYYMWPRPRYMTMWVPYTCTLVRLGTKGVTCGCQVGW